MSNPANTFPPYSTTNYPVTGKVDRYWSEAGYSRLARVEVERIYGPASLDCGGWSWQVEYARVLAFDVDGNCWESTAKRGESEDEIARLLAARGYTTDREYLA